MLQSRRRTLGHIAAGALLAAGLAACSAEKKARFHSVDISGVDYAGDFSLVDFNGQPRTLQDFKGKAVVVFFGYTHCPDVCPTTMAELAQVKQLLGEDGARLQVLFISVDPARDTPEVLKAYMGAFDPSFLALYTDSPEKLETLARDFKIYYKRVDGQVPGSYSMDHSAASYAYDPQGRLRLFMRYGMPPKDVADDLRQLLNGA
ncbi:MAG TPA: SCO family protein [Ottowia sp.]|uniref:SCO family protein n=1 Tax=Ottowia sp. TaxID=1898956 RepID=UPI002CA8BC0B|nr:SCO family protein [Ottowia sp.]HMN22309.1 SCO family protein [Ottowia sp.]